MSSRRFLSCGFCLVLMLSLAVFSLAADRIERIFPVSKTPSLMLTNYTGSVSVKGWQASEIKIICTKYSQNVEIDTESNANRVRVATHVFDKLAAAERARVDYQIFVPEESNLDIRSNMGTVEVENVKGEVGIDVVEAAVKVTGVSGYIHARSLGSRLAISESRGIIQTTTVSGDILFTKLDSNNLTAMSTLGNISYEGDFVSRGKYNFSTNEGAILIQCPAQASVEWEARTVKGGIESNLPIKSKNHAPSTNQGIMRQSLLGTLNQGDATVQLSTFSGKIKIIRK
jgi:DUF4097 and DUF4098 domain-containing protein YvlB